MTTKTEFQRDIELGVLPALADFVRGGGSADDYSACMQEHFDRLWSKYGEPWSKAAQAAVPAAPQVAAPADERALLEKWMLVDGDMRDPGDGRSGLITYHAAAFKDGLAQAAAPAAPGGVRPSDDTVSREDFDRISADLTRAKNLLVRLHDKHPEARSQIEGSTGSWFVWGVDRDADRSAGAGNTDGRGAS